MNTLCGRHIECYLTDLQHVSVTELGLGCCQAHQTLEWQLPDQKVRRSLVSADLSESDGAWFVTTVAWPPDTERCWQGLASGFSF